MFQLDRETLAKIWDIVYSAKEYKNRVYIAVCEKNDRDMRTIVASAADEMLNMGFREDIETILETAPKERQTVLFSATMPAEIKEISKRFQKKNRGNVRINPGEVTVSTVSQYYLEVKGPKKLDALTRMIDMYSYKLCLVFCNTKKKTSEVTEELILRGYGAEDPGKRH